MKIEICKLEPDDTILVSAKLPLTAILIQHIQSCFPNHKVKIIPADFDIKVIRDRDSTSGMVDYSVAMKHIPEWKDMENEEEFTAEDFDL